MAEFEEIKKKFGIDLEVKVDFPEYKILPKEVEFALYVLKKYNGTFVIGLKDIHDN